MRARRETAAGLPSDGTSLKRCASRCATPRSGGVARRMGRLKPAPTSTPAPTTVQQESAS